MGKELEMESRFDKYGWMTAIQESTEPQFTDREFRVAYVVCTRFTRGNGKGWTFDMDKIAELIPGNPSLERIGKMLVKLTNAGYLTRTYKRSTGPGLTAQRAFDLRTPGQNETITGTAASERQDATAEHRDGDEVSPGRYRPITGTLPSEQTSHEQPKGHLEGTSEGTSKGITEGTTEGNSPGTGDGPSDAHNQQSVSGPGDFKDCQEKEREMPGFTCDGCQRYFAGKPSTDNSEGTLCYSCMEEMLMNWTYDKERVEA